MKKIFLFLFIVLTLTGCSFLNKETGLEKPKDDEITSEETKENESSQQTEETEQSSIPGSDEVTTEDHGMGTTEEDYTGSTDESTGIPDAKLDYHHEFASISDIGRSFNRTTFFNDGIELVKVNKVLDGDSLELYLDRSKTTLTIRLYGIDTPEINTKLGSAATNLLSKMVEAYSFCVLESPQDELTKTPDGYYLGYLWVKPAGYSEFINVNIAMVENGYSKVFVDNGNFFINKFNDALAAAKKNKFGMWNITDANKVLTKLDGLPEENTPYKYGVDKAGKKLFFNGEMSGIYASTTTVEKEAVDFYVESAYYNEYYLKFEKNGEFYYINLYPETTGNQSKAIITFELEPFSSWTFDPEYSTFVTACNPTNGKQGLYYLGVYSSYETISASFNTYLGRPGNYQSSLYEYQAGDVEIDPNPNPDPDPDNGKPDPEPNPEIENCVHEYKNNICTKCHTHRFNNELRKIFGKDLIFYNNSVSNPYNINVGKYGENVVVAFYKPQINSMNPYNKYTHESFYADYTEASSYEDAYYRGIGNIKFISGSLNQDHHIPVSNLQEEAGRPVKINTAAYILDENGNYIAYIINDLAGNFDIIYYNAGYQTINEVAAYTYAFGKAPLNNNYDKNNGRDASLREWGIYGRVNVGHFYGDADRYPFQPWLPGNGDNGSNYYTETDYGTQGGYTNGNRYQKPYVTGNVGDYYINRGSARFCFVSNQTSIDKRHVYYTYNHYNDFQEYLNYNGGFSKRFGNESAGNPYCGSGSDYQPNYKKPTEAPDSLLKNYDQMRKI